MEDITVVAMNATVFMGTLSSKVSGKASAILDLPYMNPRMPSTMTEWLRFSSAFCGKYQSESASHVNTHSPAMKELSTLQQFLDPFCAVCLPLVCGIFLARLRVPLICIWVKGVSTGYERANEFLGIPTEAGTDVRYLFECVG